MKKQILFVAFLVALLSIFSLCAFASETEVTTVDEITAAISQASTGDTVDIKLGADIEYSSSISIAKGITVNLDFNGYQLNYTGNSGKDSDVAGICVGHASAVVNLMGNNPLADYKTYDHYGDGVKADMTGTGNLLYVSFGTVNITDMYMYAKSTYVIYGAHVAGADYAVNVKSSVLRVPEGASVSAITFIGGDKNNSDVKNRVLMLTDSVEYGGFFGSSYNFNVLAGSEFTNVKFYDFYIVNDCWYSPDALSALLMNSVEKALPVTSCVFQTYAGESGNIKIYTATGKQNLRLYNCEFNEFERGSSFSGDRGGSACVYIVKTQPTCISEGLMDYHETTQGGTYTFYENKTVAKSDDHVYGEEAVVYKNGYTKDGIGVAVCTLCNTEGETSNVYEPLLESLGYSVNESFGSVSLGAKLNREAAEKCAAFANEAFDFGVLVGNEALEVEVVDNAVVATNGFAVSMKATGSDYFDVKITGFNDTNKDLGFLAEFYVYDGEALSYVNESTISTYNEIVELLDTVKREVNALLESKHKLYYNEDGSFKVMILADLHVRANSDTTQLEERIKRFVDEENPNLVILTGDNTIGASTEENLRTCLDKIVGYIEENEIPWCHVYGNHDREGALSNDAQQAVYESYEYCISKDVDGVSGVGNYVHGVYNSDGTLGSVIYFLDSGTSNGTYGYDYIQADQIAWYEETSELLKEYNGGEAVKGMMAFHIPLKENQYAYDNRDNTEIVYEYSGEKYEAICPSSYDTGLLEAIILRGDVQAIVTGHDHNNTYMYNYQGVKLCSAPTISKLGYSNSEAQEGVRVFDLNLDTIDDIKTYVSYVIERINPDNYDALDSNVTIGDFEGNAPETDTAFLGGGTIQGSLTLNVVEGMGVDGSSAMEVKRSQTSNSELYIYLNEEGYGKIGSNKYLVVWMDFTNVEFRKACTGLLSDAGIIPFMTDNDDGTNPPYYYLADGESEWVEYKHGGDGCFGANDGGGIKGKKGYFAFRIEDYLKSQKGTAMTENDLVTGFYMYLDIASGDYADVPFYIDNIMLVEDYTTVK